MSGPVTLRYARVQKRWTRRRIILFALLTTLGVAGGSLGYLGYHSIRPRIQFLNNHPWLKPIDWSTVLTSPTLCKLAWKLSSDRTAIARFLDDPNGVAGVSLFGTDPNRVELDLEFPLSYADGKLTLRLAIRNTGRNSLLVPPFEQADAWLREGTSAGLLAPVDPLHFEWSVQPAWEGKALPRFLEGERWERRASVVSSERPDIHVDDLPELSSLSISYSTTPKWFSTGVRVIGPGQTQIVELCAPAPAQPVPTMMWIRVPSTVIRVYEVGIGTFGRVYEGYKSWNDVPRSLLRSEWRRPQIWERHRGEGGRLPPVLFPDEREPKPWENLDHLPP